LKLPKSIKVGCHKYKVLYPYHFTERYDQYGQRNDGLKCICITDLDGNGNKRPDSAILVTFIHELLHVVEDVTGHNVFERAKEKEEKVVEGFSECIGQILIDNKKEIQKLLGY